MEAGRTLSGEDFGPEQKIRKLKIKHLLRSSFMMSAGSGRMEEFQNMQKIETVCCRRWRQYLISLRVELKEAVEESGNF